MNAHALDVLEYREALTRVARLASSAPGAAEMMGFAPATDPAWITSELALVGEMTTLLARDGGWAMPAVPDLREPLTRLRVEGSVWDAVSLRDGAVLIRSSSTTRRSLRADADSAPGLAAEAEGLLDEPKLAESIERAIDEDGEVRDGATPELARLRREMSGARQRIVTRLTSYAASLPANPQVPDASVTVREGRYVIAVRREGRGEVGGIVHDESGTGATLFIEPPVAIEMMNRLRELEAEEAREVHRILRELTGTLRPLQPELDRTLATLIRIDTLHARGRYARQVEGAVPEMLPAGATGYRVVRGHHPLLLGGDGPVVPFDLSMGDNERTLLISGPNTGGKTVLLKGMGLISLLAQSGIVPPVGPGTKLPVFREVFADIGDEQSIEASLSTFSAHLRNLRETLEFADGESLVLIDEIGSGTDPVEGGALAQAILLELTRRSCFTVATTHLGQLKLLPSEDPRVVNGSLRFDADRLAPTYRLLKGVPGRSYGLAMARRLGMPAALLDDAEAAMPRGERDVARLLIELEAKEQRLSEATAQLDEQLARATSLQASLEERERELRDREVDAERRARQQARDLLMHSRQEVEAAIREVRGVADQEELDNAAHAARRRVEEAASRQREKLPVATSRTSDIADGGALEVGVRVRIGSLGRTGRVVELRDGKAMVETGGLKMLLPSGDLSVLPAGDQEASEQRRPRASGYVPIDMDARPEVDLRGLRVEDLDLQLGRALDAALVSGLPYFRIIHGKGTGALRAEVHELLRADPRIGAFRPGDRFEGGTGVTVIDFT